MTALCAILLFLHLLRRGEREAERVALLLHPTLRFFFFFSFSKEMNKKKDGKVARTEKKTITKIKEI